MSVVFAGVMPGSRRPHEFPPALVGYAAERLVEVYAILGAGGKLTSFRPGSDVDHKDLILDERGGTRSAYVQVKCATHPDEHDTVRFFARYPDAAIPSSPRLVYVNCVLDVNKMDLPRIWFVPSPDFNHLADRVPERPGWVTLNLSLQVSGRGHGKKFLVERSELGQRFLDLIDSAPPEEPPRIPGLLLMRRSDEPHRLTRIRTT